MHDEHNPGRLGAGIASEYLKEGMGKWRSSRK